MWMDGCRHSAISRHSAIRSTFAPVTRLHPWAAPPSAGWQPALRAVRTPPLDSRIVIMTYLGPAFAARADRAIATANGISSGAPRHARKAGSANSSCKYFVLTRRWREVDSTHRSPRGAATDFEERAQLNAHRWAIGLRDLAKPAKQSVPAGVHPGRRWASRSGAIGSRLYWCALPISTGRVRDC
jgi:hypothetical protein